MLLLLVHLALQPLLFSHDVHSNICHIRVLRVDLHGRGNICPGATNLPLGDLLASLAKKAAGNVLNTLNGDFIRRREGKDFLKLVVGIGIGRRCQLSVCQQNLGFSQQDLDLLLALGGNNGLLLSTDKHTPQIGLLLNQSGLYDIKADLRCLIQSSSGN